MASLEHIHSRKHGTICCPLRNTRVSQILDELLEKIKDLFWSTVYRFHSPVSKSISKGNALKTDLEIRKLLISPPKKHEEIIQQCAEIHSEARKFRGTPEEHHNHLQTAHAEISQMLFVAQHEEYTLEIVRPKVAAPKPDPAAGVVLPIAQKVVSRPELPKTVENILEKITQRINEVYQEHRKYGLQNSEQAMALTTAKELGKALVAPNGTLNKGIIKELRKLIPENPSEDYQKDILRVLHGLESSSKLEVVLNSIVKPGNHAYQIRNIIRSVLGLSFGEEITDVHAKQTALIALLSHLRQGPVGSCFATYIGIGLLNQKLEKCLQDFAEILSKGSATRIVDKEKKEFSFKVSIADEDLAKKFKLDRKGSFFEQPGLKAAFKQMGLLNFDKNKNEVLEKLFRGKSENETIEIDAKTLLGYFDNSELGIFAFSCETNNGLLRVWENLLAAMPEGIKGGGINTNRVIDAILTALKDQFKTSILIKGKPVVNPLKENLKNQLLARIKLVYDNKIGADGGYEIKGVNSPATFKAMVIDALKDAKDDNDNGLQTTIEKVKDYISNDLSFLKNVIWAFDDANKKVQDPVKDLESCNLPWRFEAGNSLRNTYAVEMEHPIPSPILTHPKNAFELAVSFLNVCQKLKKDTDVYTDEEDNEMVPMETPTHAFNANVESEKVKEFLKSNDTPENWLKRNLVDKSTLALKGQIDTTSRMKVYHFILNPENNLIPANIVNEFKDKFERLPNVMQMETFCKKIMEILIELNKPHATRKNELWQILSAYFLSEGLPEKARNRLDAAALPIADLSWSKDNSDLDFKVMFDVITMKPTLVGINSSKTSYKVVNQNEWVTVLIKYFPTNY